MMGGDALLSGFEDSESYEFETRAIRAGQPHDPRTGGVVTPIALATTFAQDAIGHPKNGYEYARTGNPTRHAYQACVASLEGANYGHAFASGLAAEDALLRQLSPGSEILLGDDAYGGTFRLIDKIHGKMGISNRAVDLTRPEFIRDSWSANTRLLWLETPTNPMLGIFDIEAICDIVHNLGGQVVVDNTFATPYLQQPLSLGADAVIHSATKYIGGHSDVVGGFVATNDVDIAEQLVFVQNAVGAIASPFDCYLAMRGVKTLAVRMDRHCENASQISEMLMSHNAISDVLYPGLSHHQGHQIAARQMSGFGGMVSFRLKGGRPAAETLVVNTKLFTLAESLGAVESLIEHPAVMTHASVAGSALEVPDDLVRISVGIESISDLLSDLEQALNFIG